MPITAAQLEQRKTRLGSSDMPALLGLDQYRNKYDVWLEKTGKLLPEAEDGDNTPRAAGKILEPAILSFAEGRIGKLTRNQFRSARNLGLPLGANVDGILDATGDPIEAKTSGLYGLTQDVWGEENTDQVPDRVIVQAHVHMLCTEKDICYVPVFIAFRGFLMFQVPRDPQIAEIIGNEAIDFWNNHVLADVPPTNLTPNLAVVKRIRREPSKVVQINSDLIAGWQTSKEIVKQAEKEKETALAAILTAMGDAEAGECELGTFTYLEQNRAGYTVKPTTFRVGRFTKAKA